MNNLPFGKPGKWFRGNLHTHSTRSDGHKTPAQVCAFYRRRGYDFISLTDHFLEHYDWPVTDTTAYRNNGFTTILGAELHAPKTQLGERWHILAVGLPLDFAPTTKRETGPRLADRAKRAGAYVAVAHPAWYDLTDSDVLTIKAASAIEIFNTTCTEYNGKGDSTGYLDRLLSQGHRYHAIATDDAHFNPIQPDFAQNWVMVRCKRLEPSALLKALRAGHFYASQGPQIQSMKFNRRKKTVTLTTSGVRTVRITTRGATMACVRSRADRTKAELDVTSFMGSYGRITVADRHGKKAWTNPFWF